MGRIVHVDDGFTLRFPGRDAEFAAGVEIGVLAVHMDQGHQTVSRWIATETVAHARVLADKFGYRLVKGETDGDWTRITLSHGRVRPQLKVIK